MFGNINHIACQSFEILFGRIWYKNKPPIYRSKNKTNLFIICAKNYYTKNIYIEWISINYIWKLQIVFVCDDVLLWNNPNFLSNSKSQKRTNLPKQIIENTHARVKLYQVLLYTFSALYIQIYMQFLFREKKIYKNKHQISQNLSPPVAFFCKRKKYFFKEKNKQNKNLFVFIVVVVVVKTNIYFSFFFSSKCDVLNFENLF